MNILIWLVIGVVSGWLASAVMNANDQQGVTLNVVVGVVGALLGGWFLSPLVNAGAINQVQLNLPALGASFIGAIALLAVVNLLMTAWTTSLRKTTRGSL